MTSCKPKNSSLSKASEYGYYYVKPIAKLTQSHFNNAMAIKLRTFRKILVTMVMKFLCTKEKPVKNITTKSIIIILILILTWNNCKCISRYEDKMYFKIWR